MIHKDWTRHDDGTFTVNVTYNWSEFMVKGMEYDFHLPYKLADLVLARAEEGVYSIYSPDDFDAPIDFLRRKIEHLTPYHTARDRIRVAEQAIELLRQLQFIAQIGSPCWPIPWQRFRERCTDDPWTDLPDFAERFAWEAVVE